MKGKFKIKGKVDRVALVRRLSRDVFKDSKRGTQVHKSAKTYTRKAKHKGK